MKKLWLILISMSTGLLGFYTPTQGPLTLADTPGKFGAIRSTITNNPHLQKELNTINQFINGLPLTAHTYQGMVNEIIQSQNPLALQTLQALENVIMYMYHNKAYLVQLPLGTDFLPQGIRNSWFNPFSYLSVKSWLGDNNAELDQLLTELYALANIAQTKNPFIGARMKAKVNLYRHWRKYTLAGILTYLSYDLAKRNWKNTLLYHACNKHDLDEVKNIAKKDLKDAGEFTYKQGENVCAAIKNFWNRKEIQKKNQLTEQLQKIKNNLLDFNWDATCFQPL